MTKITVNIAAQTRVPTIDAIYCAIIFSWVFFNVTAFFAKEKTVKISPIAMDTINIKVNVLTIVLPDVKKVRISIF